jgi:hypothetical protein
MRTEVGGLLRLRRCEGARICTAAAVSGHEPERRRRTNHGLAMHTAAYATTPSHHRCTIELPVTSPPRPPVG